MAEEFDFSQFETFVKTFEVLQKNFEQFLRQFLLEMANRVISKVKPKTPVDTGALKSEWQIGEVTISEDKLEVEIINGQEYASYIEYGHRLTNGKWQEGKFMLTISIDDVNQQIPLRFRKAWNQFLLQGGFGNG